jgi:hypothetical protein
VTITACLGEARRSAGINGELKPIGCRSVGNDYDRASLSPIIAVSPTHY